MSLYPLYKSSWIVEILETSNPKIHFAMVLQEISFVINKISGVEYAHAQI